jgi:uncharacterized protein (UPF0332 family)
VKEQTAAYLEKARELLDQADAIFSVRLYEPAGRTAYLAGFHAAQALIFETGGRVYKSHGGLRGEFSRLVRNDLRVDDHNRAFLGRTYNLKGIADYLTGPGSHISAEDGPRGYRQRQTVCRTRCGIGTSAATTRLLPMKAPARADGGDDNRDADKPRNSEPTASAASPPFQNSNLLQGRGSLSETVVFEMSRRSKKVRAESGERALKPAAPEVVRQNSPTTTSRLPRRYWRIPTSA